MRAKNIFTTLIFLVVFAWVTLFTQQGINTFAQTRNQAVTSSQSSKVDLNLSKSKEIGFVYEAFLSPHQEPGEEENAPKIIPSSLRSTAPSVKRNQRKSAGHGVVRFTKDLSKAFVDVRVEGVNAKDIVMFHIHCGNPDVLGPIIVDFALAGDIQQNFADNLFSLEVTNENIEKTANSASDIVGVYTLGCPIESGKPGKVKTIAGMEQFAKRSELYFNLHTKGQTFFGDMRGKLNPVQS
ncbi:CHRD domain-containing protein [Calothrix sp. NIES-2100]|uniref:CHRD domain-containing protein n=1 Tax=Calothrix sp. NIES-2100 TaxID=1954172 RepID=UPI000B611CAD|nr:CHRD domain-containing protein [Calothrix sp. NIES-2100]